MKILKRLRIKSVVAALVYMSRTADAACTCSLGRSCTANHNWEAHQSLAVITPLRRNIWSFRHQELEVSKLVAANDRCSRDCTDLDHSIASHECMFALLPTDVIFRFRKTQRLHMQWRCPQSNPRWYFQPLPIEM